MAAEAWTFTQQRALSDVARWLRDPMAPQVFRLFGYAGTGKTTLARYFAEQEGGTVLFAAYTGKAASVLRDKGCPGATTLHSLLYNVTAADRGALCEAQALLATYDPNSWEAEETRREIEALEAQARRPAFLLNPDSDLRTAKLLVLDEVSMVDAKLAAHILSFRVKVLVLGDPAQLPPITGEGYFTKDAPNILLSEIHRQAAESPIIRWATLARKGEAIPYGRDGDVYKVKRSNFHHITSLPLKNWLATEAGQLLCGKNATRNELNTVVRAQRGFTEELPQKGDTLVCLRNNHQLGLLNGMLCHAASDTNAKLPGLSPGIVGLHVRRDTGEVLHDLLVDAGPFYGEAPNEARYDLVRVDYGYALTVHKAQGSQWPVVTIYDDGFGKQDAALRRRWLYTAITRAQHTLHIMTSG